MSDHPRASSHAWRRALIWWLPVAGLILCNSAVWLGCSVTPENYKAWAFFFDGVPDPSARPMVGGIPVEGGASAVSQIAFIHKPYLDEDCNSCHRSGLPFTRRDSSGCLSCHEGVPTEHRFTHGPVAANACLWCHTPHESAFPHLLRETDRRLCSRCHSVSMLDVERVPAHADPQQACLNCHFGHGGDQRYNLRPNTRDSQQSAADER